MNCSNLTNFSLLFEIRRILICIFYAPSDGLGQTVYTVSQHGILPAVQNFICTCCCFPIFSKNLSVSLTMLTLSANPIKNFLTTTRGLEPHHLPSWAFNPGMLFFKELFVTNPLSATLKRERKVNAFSSTCKIFLKLFSSLILHPSTYLRTAF